MKLGLTLGAAIVLAGRARRGPLVRRAVVAGGSMRPAFDEGDRLVVLRLPAAWPLRPGDVVALSDPRTGTRARSRAGAAFDAGRLLVKRVVATGPAGIEVEGDNPAASTDSRTFGPVHRSVVAGLVVYRYGPRGRTGWVRRGQPRPRHPRQRA